MDLHSLRILALVARQGSFAAAARVLNLDPSSVSRSVAQVEAELGLRVFQRTTRALRVTEEGARYLARIAPLLDELQQAEEEARGTRGTPAGQLRMTASVAFAHECIVPHLAAFRTRFPQISIELLPTDANLDIAAEGIDLAIRLSAAPAGDLVTTRLIGTRYRVCASPDYVARTAPIRSPQDLSDHACLRFALPQFRSRWRFQASDAPACDVAVGGDIVIGNALSLRQAARDGLGPVMLADWLVGRDLAEGRLVDLFPEHACTATEFDTAAWALYPSRTYLPQKVRVMIDFLRQRLQAPARF